MFFGLFTFAFAFARCEQALIRHSVEHSNLKSLSLKILCFYPENQRPGVDVHTVEQFRSHLEYQYRIWGKLLKGPPSPCSCRNRWLPESYQKQLHRFYIFHPPYLVDGALHCVALCEVDGELPLLCSTTGTLTHVVDATRNLEVATDTNHRYFPFSQTRGGNQIAF